MKHRLWQFYSAFQILLYRGSHVPSFHYQPLLQRIQTSFPDASVDISDYSFFERNHFQEDTIVIGHSFGGYFALLDAQETCNQDTLKGIVLLHSHFNSRKSAWYPRVRQETIRPPVLTIAGKEDTRLPIRHVLSDLWQKKDEHLRQSFYLISENHTHFSGLSGCENDPDVEKLVVPIIEFIKNVRHHDFTSIQTMCLPSETKYSYEPLYIPKMVNYRLSMNFMDALMKLVMYPWFWDWIHHMMFLMDKPTSYKNIVYEDRHHHILIKSQNLTRDEVIRFCRATLSDEKKIDVYFIRAPVNIIGLYQWLLWPLEFHLRKTEEDTLLWPVIELQVNEHVTYYKILHPKHLILKSI